MRKLIYGLFPISIILINEAFSRAQTLQFKVKENKDGYFPCIKELGTVFHTCNLRSAMKYCGENLNASYNGCTFQLPNNAIVLDDNFGRIVFHKCFPDNFLFHILGNYSSRIISNEGNSSFLELISTCVSHQRFHMSNVILSGFYYGGISIINFDYISITSCVITNNTRSFSVVNSTLLELSHVSFQYSHMTFNNHYGGCIFASSISNITVNNCSFQYCSAGLSGGSIYAYNISSFKIYDSRFQHNHVGHPSLDHLLASPQVSGGALSMLSVLFGDISSCTFTNNSADAGNGGALYFDANHKSVTISHSLLSENTAYYGGALYFAANGDSASLLFCKVSRNSAIDGGGIYFDDSFAQMKVHATKFLENIATFRGGALFTLQSTEHFNMSACWLSGNAAGGSGGALWIGPGSADLMIADTQFTSNIARSGAGGGLAINDYSARVRLVRSCFSYNSAVGAGGAVYIGLEASIISVFLCNFEDNMSSTDGGAVMMYAYVNFAFFTTCNFTRNRSGRAGGGIAAIYDSNAIYIVSCYFTGNFALWGGGTSVWATNFVSVIDTMFRANVADYGAGLSLIETQYTSVVGCSLVENEAYISGAGLMLFQLNVRVAVLACSFLRNSVFLRGAGVAIYSRNEDIRLQDCSFQDKSASQFGGAMFVGEGNSFQCFDGCRFAGNSASVGGGVCLDSSNDLSLARGCGMSNNSFSFNVAFLRGGALSVGTSNSVSLTSSIFTGNEAGVLCDESLCGGGAVALSDRSDVAISGTKFVGNVAVTQHGGAILFFNSFNMTVTGCTFQENSALDGYGGAIYANGFRMSVVSLESVHLERNVAAITGGAVYAEYVFFLNVSGSTLVLNKAAGRGGAVMATSCSGVQVMSNLFTSNAGFFGGGLYVSAAMVLEVSSNHFVGNNALYGSAVAFDDTNIWTISNNSFKRNSAYGGTVYLDASSIDTKLIDLQSNIWVNNIAGYGDTVASQPIGLSFNNSVASNLNVTSGGNLPQFIIAIVDSFDHTVYLPEFYEVFVTLSASSTKSAFIAGETTVLIKSNGSAKALFHSVMAQGYPGSSLVINAVAYVVSTLESNLPITSDLGIPSSLTSASMNVRFRRCTYGEYYALSEKCILCPNGSYSLEDNSDMTITSCRPCPLGSSSCYGSTIKLSPGYWRISSMAWTIFECPLSSACLGGAEVGDASCAEGYKGPLCELCASGYRRSDWGYSCAKCGSVNYFLAVVIIVFFLAMLALLWRAFNLGSEMLHLDNSEIVTDLTSTGVISTNISSQSLEKFFSVTVYYTLKRFGASVWRLFGLQLKLLITSYQILSNFPTTLNLSFGDTFRSLSEALGWMNLNLMDHLGISCSLSFDHFDVLRTATLLPALLTLLLLLGYLINRMLIMRRGRRRNFEVNKALVANLGQYFSFFLLLSYLVLPGVSIIVFRSFTCVDVDPDKVTAENTRYLRADMSINCDSPEYFATTVWAIVSIICYPVGVPLLYLILLFRVRKDIAELSLHKNEDRQEFGVYKCSREESVHDHVTALGILFASYKPRYWYWEVG